MYLKFKEQLPSGCPSSESQDRQLKDVWRFLESEQIASDSFDSHAAKGKGKPSSVCGCAWASCSLFVGDKYTQSALRLPRYKRFKARAELSIPKGAGLSKENGRHVDFWAFDAFDFSKNVVRVLKK